MAWNRRQQITLAMVPKVSSVFSLVGSSWIAFEVLTGKQQGRSGVIKSRTLPYHRLLLAMSVYDILESVWNFVSTWPIPAGTLGVYDPRGTTATCTAQGFFLTLSVAVPIYNACLSLYYVLVVNFRMTDTQLKKWVEPAMHATAFVWAFGTALVSAGMGLINNANLWCWIAPFPGDCLDSRRYGDQGNCERGDNAWVYRWAFYFAPLWGCILFATVCTLMVCSKVKGLDRRTLFYRQPHRRAFDPSALRESIDDLEPPPAPEPEDVSGYNMFTNWWKRRQRFIRDNPRTVEVQRQAALYLLVFALTHVWSTSNRIVQQLNNGNTYFGLIAVHSFFDPLQGFLNFLVYQRPRYVRIRRAYPELGRWRALRKALTFSYRDANVPKESSRSRKSSKRNSFLRENAQDSLSRMSRTHRASSSVGYTHGRDGRTGLDSIHEEPGSPNSAREGPDTLAEGQPQPNALTEGQPQPAKAQSRCGSPTSSTHDESEVNGSRHSVKWADGGSSSHEETDPKSGHCGHAALIVGTTISEEVILVVEGSDPPKSGSRNPSDQQNIDTIFRSDQSTRPPPAPFDPVRASILAIAGKTSEDEVSC